MDVSLKKKFIPQIQEDDTDINTTLFIFIQIVAENVGSKKLLVKYVKKDGVDCIFDGVQDLLKTVSIELELVPMDPMEFYNFSLMDEPPHLIYVDDILQDPVISQAMMNTVPPSCFIISREVNNFDNRFTEDYYLPVYKIGKGQNKLELVRWNVLAIWTLIESRTRISVVPIRSESDLEEMNKSLKNTSVYHQQIIVTNYPDQFGVKEKVLAQRKNKKHCYVVFTNSDIDEKTVTSRIRRDLMYSVFKDGIWGGEYYVPALTSN